MDFTTLLVTRCQLKFQRADIAVGLSRMPRCGLRASTTRLALIRPIISLSFQPVIYSAPTSPMPADKLKEKGKKFLSSVKQTISRSRSRTPANRTSQPDPSSASLLTPTRPAHSASPSARPSTEVGIPSSHLPEDFNGVSETRKQDDHAAIAADDPQSAPHAVSV